MCAYSELQRNVACGAQRRAASRKPLLSPVPEYETRWQGGGQWSQSHWPSGPRLHGGRKAASALAATSRRLPPFPCRQRGTAEAAGSARRPHAERWPCTTTTRGRARPTSMPRYRLGRLAEARPRPGLPPGLHSGPRHPRKLGGCAPVLSPVLGRLTRRQRAGPLQSSGRSESCLCLAHVRCRRPRYGLPASCPHQMKLLCIRGGHAGTTR